MNEAIDRIVATFFNIPVMIEVFPDLMTVGLPNTLLLSLAAILVAIVIGLITTLLLLSNRVWVRLPARIYVDVFRGVPGLLTIFIVGVGLPIAGLDVFGRNSYAYAALAMGLIQGAYIAEIFRGGIQSLDKGQMEAARSLGLPYFSAMAYVIVPQGVRRVLPPLTGQFILTIKESALIYILGLLPMQQEMFAIAQAASSKYVSMSPIVLAGALYLLITIPLTYAVNALDRRLRDGSRVITEGTLPAEITMDGERIS